MQSRPIFPVLVLALALCAPGFAPAQQAREDREGTAAEGEGGEVGVGERMAREGMGPGAYISTPDRAKVRAWVARHHGPGKPCLRSLEKQGDACVRPAGTPSWQVGVPLPDKLRLRKPPLGLLRALPPEPPGNRYAIVGGDVLLVAERSRMVVDAVPLMPQAAQATGATPPGTPLPGSS